VLGTALVSSFLFPMQTFAGVTIGSALRASWWDTDRQPEGHSFRAEITEATFRCSPPITQPAVEAGVVVLSTVAPRSPAGLSWSDLR